MRRRPRTRGYAQAEAAAAPSVLLDLTSDALHVILSHLPLAPFCHVGATCRALRAATSEASLLSRVPLDSTEDPVFSAERERLLRRLADAGNAAACYRLGLAYAYHPRPTEERRSPLEDSARFLRRAMVVGDRTIAADAAYELWLLTRRLPASAATSEELLHFAASAGHSPARFAAHRSRASARQSSDFHTSAEFATVQSFLVAANDEAPLDAARFSVCRNPACGRWGVRAREVRRRSEAGYPALQAPPGLPRCQGMFGMHCRTRYCSRYCQALHWPEHRKECSLPEPPPPLPVAPHA